MSTEPGRFRLPVARGWLLLGLAILCAAVVAVADRRLKAPPHAGFVPADATLVAAARDLPSAWDTFFALPTGRTLNDGLRSFRQDAERNIRLRTGIRPTPARWSTWLGRPVLAANRNGTWGLCVRPGFLLHAANRVFNRGADGGVYNGIHFQWRDGFLLVSAQQAWVAAAADAPAYANNLPNAANAVVFHWAGGHATLDAAPGMPVRIQLEPRGDAVPEESEAVLPLFAAEDTPIAALSVANIAVLEEVYARVNSFAESYSLWRTVTEGVGSTLAQWGTSAAAIAGRLRTGQPILLALTSLDTGLPAPVPVVAFVQPRQQELPGEHPLLGIAANAESMPGYWAGHEGAQAPLLGPALVLCTADTPDYWFAATQEPAMHALLQRELVQSPTPSDAALTINWTQSAQEAAALLRRFKDWQLLPAAMAADLDHAWMPLVDAAAGLGHARFKLTIQPDGWRIQGQLDERGGPEL